MYTYEVQHNILFIRSAVTMNLIVLESKLRCWLKAAVSDSESLEFFLFVLYMCKL